MVVGNLILLALEQHDCQHSLFSTFSSPLVRKRRVEMAARQYGLSSWSMASTPSVFIRRKASSSSSLKVVKRRWLRALVDDPSDSTQENMDKFAQRMEKAWLISKQPHPISCTSCNTKGQMDCPWCKGTGFFILGDNLLCQVPSKNTTCLICHGQGNITCKDCKGTGYRAEWMGLPPQNNSQDQTQ